MLDDYNWEDYINRYEDLRKANILTKHKALIIGLIMADMKIEY
jgi:hypothetical protein